RAGVVMVLGAERRQIGIVVRAFAVRGNRARRRAKEDVVGAEDLRAGRERQGRIALRRRSALVIGADRNQRVVVDDRGAVRGNIGGVSAVAALAGIDADDAPAFDLRSADVDVLLRRQGRIGLGAGT